MYVYIHTNLRLKVFQTPSRALMGFRVLGEFKGSAHVYTHEGFP